MQKRKQMIVIVAALMITVCGCRQDITSTELNTKSTEKSSISQESTESTPANDDAQYIGNDIYINSFECGYLSGENKPPAYQLIIIENAEQLAYAQGVYGLAESSEENTVKDVFLDMVSQYSIDEYTYVLYYDEVSSGGYYLHADQLVISDENIYFCYDDMSFSPEQDDVVTCVMGGFCSMAAVPKELITNHSYLGVIYPNVNDI